MTNENLLIDSNTPGTNGFISSCTSTQGSNGNPFYSNQNNINSNILNMVSGKASMIVSMQGGVH
jgi:hypothetical protein